MELARCKKMGIRPVHFGRKSTDPASVHFLGFPAHLAAAGGAVLHRPAEAGGAGRKGPQGPIVRAELRMTRSCVTEPLPWRIRTCAVGSGTVVSKSMVAKLWSSEFAMPEETTS